MKNNLIYMVVVIAAVLSAMYVNYTVIDGQIESCSDLEGVYVRTPLTFECVRKVDICKF